MSFDAPVPLTSEELELLDKLIGDEYAPLYGYDLPENTLERLVATARSTQASADKAERIAAEAYQLIGAIANVAGMFDTPEVQHVLDYFSGEDMDGSILPYAPPSDRDADKVSLEREVLMLRRPITMADVRLMAGEGKLSADTVLQAVNAILMSRTSDCVATLAALLQPQLFRPCASYGV